MAEALLTEPTGPALSGVGLARAQHDVGVRRIGDQGDRFRSRMDTDRKALSEFVGAVRRKKRGEIISDILTIAGLATGGILGAGTKIGTAGGIALGGQAGQLLGAGIGGQPAAPELQAIPTLAGNLRDQSRYGDLEAAAGVDLLGLDGTPKPRGTLEEVSDLETGGSAGGLDEFRPMRNWARNRRMSTPRADALWRPR